ncbi:stabilin-1 isoform X1 [Cuculus canorus]|uniref:stabilin-1 isoform X1 n=1 Tax=Cuculus canorus TaxID=55661 RepID=UPI0023AA500A|nr:stabilin-1 isoform X1 [Cuculus canorus]XP_053932501.1 stabilin-1 isoform X1 [Cuculus canorus]XP_053932502.1 stabilin-1 isoform X1 [Cuculus canorus]
MKMHPPGLLFFFLAACFTPTADCQSQKLKSMRCNVKTMFTMNTECTSCAAAPKMLCPRGWLKTTQGLGLRDCRYTVKLGENTLSLPGCHHICKKEIEEKKCCPGFWGSECYECLGGSQNPCNGHGTCLDGIQQNGTCICKEQYSGFACQNCRDENRFGPDCQSVCDCVHGECNSGVTGDGSCTCYGGYTGPRCDQELPLCKGVTCKGDSECVVRDGTAMCDCKLGYRKSGSTCQAQDPCASSPCSPFAACKVLGPRNYECTCKEGFQGDGKVCQPINPCVESNGGCPENSTICVYRRPGEATCVCKPGMSRRTPLSECSAFPSDCQQYFCDVSSTCEINSQGNPSCVCKEGEIGDGRNCYKDLLSEINQHNSRGRFARKLNVARKMFASGCSVLLTKYGPFTIFVPSLLPIQDTMEFNDTTAEQLCRMHIVPGVHLAEDMVKTKTLWTLSGQQLIFSSQVYVKSFRYQDLPGKLYNVLQPNLPAANGVMHIINTLRKETSTGNLGNPQKTIGEILASMEIFSRFETILENCGLPAILDGPGPFTVFVPSNDGVDKLRDGRLIYLFTEGINKLQELVKHHIYTSAAVTVEKLIMMPHIVTMANQIVTINISADGRILMDESGIPLNMRDIVASNGIIHTLDGIFIPPSIIPILPHRCNEEQYKIVTGSCVDCEALNNSICPPGSREMEPTLYPKECVYIHDPQGLNVLKKGCARYCNQTVVKPGCCKGFFGPDCMPCPGGFSSPCYGRGNCSDGIQGNGNCQCFEGFKGIACHICSNPNKHGENCDEDCGCVHGICDNRPGSGGVCQSWSCKEGYTGEFCDKTSKNCGPSGLSQYCHQNAVCSLNDTTRCICIDGYEGDGFSCQPIDLCSQPDRGGCSQNALCTSTGPGTATCQCNTGWTGDGKACVAIDNCMLESRGNCHMNADCIYIGPGQSKCVCKRGYAGDGHNCDAINPCLMDNGGCHDLATCVPLGGGERSCTCPEGYMGDGMTCYGDILKELARNSHFAGFYDWLKKSLFSIPAGMNVTVLVPSEAAIKNLSKTEKDLWLTSYMLPFLVRAHFVEGVFTVEKLKKYDRPELSTLNPQTRWQINNRSGVLTIQNASIVVSDIPASNGIIHVLSKVLLPPSGDIPASPPGLQEQLEAVASFSIFKGLLQEYQLIGKIESSEKYTVFVPGNNSIEEFCRAGNVTCLDNETVQYHVVLGEKLSPTDLRSGIHKNSMLGLSYWLMFYQNSTQKFVNNIPLDGKFLETKNGMLIGVSQVLQIQKNRCTANTTTIQKSRCGKCEKGIKCPPGSVLVELPGSKNLARCELRSEDTGILGCHFTCAKVSLRSICCPGYYGHMCEMCPGKPGQWCSGNGECQDGTEGSGECRCLEGFHGTACEMCEVGRYGADCKSECACDNGICNDGLQGDGSCECFPGWKGPTCQERIKIDLCNNTCHQMANCLNSSVDSTPTCVCSAGHTGNGTHCTEIDPCIIDHGGCSVHAVCTKVSPGERTCVCKEGYAGDGTLCLEVDRCLESNGGCHSNAECIKTGPKKVACNCLPGYSGDGVSHCNPINLCEQNNGGCSPFGLCKYTGPGTRNCSCSWHSVGDGFTCHGKVHQELGRIKDASVFFKMMLAENIKELSGAGPFTVFVPQTDFIANTTTFEEWRSRGLLRDLLRYHMVGCQKFLSSDLEAHKSLTSLSGHKIKITVKENSIYLNEEAKVVVSDIIGVNGVIHFINEILIPSDLGDRNISQISRQNITEAAEAFGYSIYSKLLQDTELLPLINDPLHRPFTMLWPTDAAFNALPEKNQRWLYHREHRDVLASYLKAHMIRDTKIVAANMPQVESIRTMHGSTVSFSCSKTHVGELLVGNGDATIIQRHMEFNGGIAYGIDRLLEPPDLGSRCDEFTFVELQGSTESCGVCGFEPPCPAGSVQRGETRRCYYYGNQMLRHTFRFHRNSLLRPSWSHSPWDSFRRHFSSRGPLKRGCRRSCVSAQWVPQCCANHYGRDCWACPGGLEAPCSNRGTCDDKIGGSGRCNCTQAFIGTNCELCAPGRYGPDCLECNCTENGVCNGGVHGDGFCFCAEGWTGDRCEIRQVVTPTCSPPCHPQAICRSGNLCECNLHYEGDGRACSVIDMCSQDNGGCARHAHCTQVGVNVSCACAPGYGGDGYICDPIDRCADGRNGDCSQHANCISTGPNERRCECKRGYVGDGIQCLEEVVPPTDRCLQDNGQCHREAICTDLHFHDKTMGVFHLQSPQRKYDFTYEQARAACAAEGASLATFRQLAAAQQMGFHLCLVGWLDNGTAGYPTAYPNPSCGSNRVGIVDYGFRSNLSETWDAFCYREKDLTCACRDGFVGDGYWCSGKLPDVLADDTRFSTFYSMLLDFANDTEEGLDFFIYLSDDSAPKTLFVPLNSGFADNETLTGDELKLHVSSSNVVLFSYNLTTGTIIPSQSGYDLHVSDLPAGNSTEHADTKGINDTRIVEWDIMAFNGIIHVIAEPLRMPPPNVHLGQVNGAAQGSVATGTLSALCFALVLAAGAGVAYYCVKRRREEQFRYFQADLRADEEEEAGPQRCPRARPLVAIPNPLYGTDYEPLQDALLADPEPRPR